MKVARFFLRHGIICVGKMSQWLLTRSCLTSDPVTSWMGECLQGGKLPGHETYRPLKIMTDCSHARVRELGSISIFSFFTMTLSNVVRLLQNFVHIVNKLAAFVHVVCGTMCTKFCSKRTTFDKVIVKN